MNRYGNKKYDFEKITSSYSEMCEKIDFGSMSMNWLNKMIDWA